uniref:B-cell linker protein isoform X2 n=2 Tax=Geotrypetes seraphini TaxID=260995 RepID=A0A6P8RE63_GEOSA|nr:B-cell linker protein isoform X2 [Geotrypetes seraphini]
MASKLPLREEFESWTPYQVADLLQQFGMYESSTVIEELGINGTRFLNTTDYELMKFSIIDVPQIQKMVHDIKKNEGGFMSKIKKITNKAPPSVPHRDYIEDEDDEDHWSDDFDSDYENPDEQHSDSEHYVIPGEEDNYEPPPIETAKKIAPGFTFPKGEYADNRANRQPPFSKPLPSVPSQPAAKTNSASSQPQSAVKKPFVSPMLLRCNNDEDDYVVPVDDGKEDEDNNYIEPTQESLPQLKKLVPPVTRSTKPTPPCPAKSPATPVTKSTPLLYEVLDKEEKPSPPLPNRTTKPLPPKPTMGLNLPSLPNRNAIKESSVIDPPRNVLPLPRNHSQPKIVNPELPQDDEYEICDDNHNDIEMSEPKLSSVSVPAPLPRMGKKMPTPPKPKPNVPSKENLNIDDVKPTVAERRRGSSVGSELPPVPALKPAFQKPAALTKPPDVTSRNTGTLSRNSPSSSIEEQEAGVYSKIWYASSCDRKAAEEALHKSNKDGSFLVRKSSGQDLKQPYTLVVFYNRRVFNIPIRYIESTKQYAMGREKSGEEHFDSVADMIQNHQRNPLVLIDNQNNTKDSTKLKYPVRVS